MSSLTLSRKMLLQPVRGMNTPIVSSCMSYKATNRRRLMLFLCGVGCKRTLALVMEVMFLSYHHHRRCRHYHPSLHNHK